MRVEQAPTINSIPDMYCNMLVYPFVWYTVVHCTINNGLYIVPGGTYSYLRSKVRVAYTHARIKY